MPVDCCFRLALPVPLRIVNLSSKKMSPFNFQLLFIILDYFMIYLLYLAVKLWWTETDMKSWFQLGCYRRLHCHFPSASSVSWRGSLLTHASRHWQDLAAAFHFLFSCSLLPITCYSNKLIFHLRAFMRSYKYRILNDTLTDVSDNNREIAPLSLARSS